MSYWGIRELDSEIVFRTTQALATSGSFAVQEELSFWKGFGLSTGTDGKRYSVFGPGEAIIAVPFYKLAELLNASQWYLHANDRVGRSFYINNGLRDFLSGHSPEDLPPHALRMVTSLLNIIFASLCVFVFFLTIKALTRSEYAALCTGILFAFGSLVLPYSGTFFSEILATFFVMLSFYILVYNDLTGRPRNRLHVFLSGIFLGLGTATHITALLFAPFFCIYSGFPYTSITRTSIKSSILDMTLFTAGCGPTLALLAYYNCMRFNNIFETGRTLGDTAVFGYGVFVAPWQGLWGLLFSGGKGLFVFCPAIILSMLAWPAFHRKHRFLSCTILAAAVLRIIFIASRSDWHGGFSLGPRYLIMLIPFLMLPIGEWMSTLVQSKNMKALSAVALASLVCIAQQIYFSLGEIFSFFHIIKKNGACQGINVFQDNLVYLSWNLSPLQHLLKGKRGPLLLQSIETDNYTLWLFLVLLSALALSLVYVYVLKNIFSQQKEPRWSGPHA